MVDNIDSREVTHEVQDAGGIVAFADEGPISIRCSLLTSLF